MVMPIIGVLSKMEKTLEKLISIGLSIAQKKATKVAFF